MRVYRLQTAEGRGAYRISRYGLSLEPSYVRDEYAYNVGDPDDPHPAPSTDGIGDMQGHEYCGFGSTDALQAWFFREDADAGALESMGLLVTVWEAPEVRTGTKQLVFHRERATLLESFTPTKFKESLT